MKVHIHDNTQVPHKQNCMTEIELEPDKVLTLHMHSGECRFCPKGHCHHGSINLIVVNGALYVVFEDVKPPELITLADAQLHTPITH